MEGRVWSRIANGGSVEMCVCVRTAHPLCTTLTPPRHPSPLHHLPPTSTPPSLFTHTCCVVHFSPCRVWMHSCPLSVVMSLFALHRSCPLLSHIYIHPTRTSRTPLFGEPPPRSSIVCLIPECLSSYHRVSSQLLRMIHQTVPMHYSLSILAHHATLCTLCSHPSFDTSVADIFTEGRHTTPHPTISGVGHPVSHSDKSLLPQRISRTHHTSQLPPDSVSCEEETHVDSTQEIDDNTNWFAERIAHPVSKGERNCHYRLRYYLYNPFIYTIIYIPL